ncbi:unnamed protein product [Spodoptera exigua]|nr:unnamed protein product [Spodoptera exigua]
MLRRIYPLVVLLVFADVVIKASCTEKGSLTFVIDDTLSMDDDIYYVKRSMDWIMDTVFKNNSTMISNMVLVTFNNSDARVRVVAQNQCDFDKALKEVSAHSKDYPEVLSMTGLILALKESNYGSYIYVFTDASAKDHDNVHIVKQLCQEKQSQISFVITAANKTLHYRDKKKAVYHDIAQACSGLAYEVNKPEVSEILKSIRYIVGGENILVVQASFPDDVPKHNYVQFEVDKLTEFYIVSTVGKNVKFAWQSTKRYKAWWDLKSTIVDEENCKVDKIVKKTPGKYTLSVFSEKKTSLMLVGRSEFIFKHGFSELKPQSINDTFLQPIANAKVHLSILVSDKHQQVEITEAQILGMNDKQITPNLTLTKVSKDFYVTSPLVTPTQMFKIVVIGKLNATGQSIKRFTKIPITPIKLPDNQALTVMIAEGKEMSVEYNSSLKLTCKVTAFPIPKISWLNKQGQHLASNTSMIEYPYEYISYLEMPVAKADSYMCSVINDIGLKNSSIRVEVKDPFTVVNTPKRLKVPYGKSGALKCDIKSTLPMDIHWYHVDDMAGIKKKLTDSNDYSISVDKTELTIIKMDLYLTGKYVCNVYLKHNKDVKKDFSKLVEVTGLVVPNVQAQSKVTVVKGSTAVLKCNVSGVPMPSIEWHYEDNSGSKVTVRSPAGTESTLLITNAKRNNEGQYKCLAENVLDKDEKVTTLIVQEKPQLAGVDAKKVILGMPVDIECRIVEGWPKPNITWFMEISDKNFTTIAETGEVIHIAKAENNHTGRYRCVAQNEIGSAEHFTSLTVECTHNILRAQLRESHRSQHRQHLV